jgi:hypothetical protein
VKLYTLESLYQYSKDSKEFVRNFDSGVHKLPVFQKIHSSYNESSTPETQSEESESEQNVTSMCSLFSELSSELKKNLPKSEDHSELSSQYTL